MRLSRLMVSVSFAALMCACTGDGSTPTAPNVYTAPLQVTSSGTLGAQAQPDGIARNHRTHLSGDNEVFPAPPGAPTPADSTAQGQAIFQIADDSRSFDYKLIASNIDNVVQAHIHCGVPGMNGPIVVWLYPSVTATAALQGPTGRHDGVLVEGTVVRGTPLNVRTAPVSAACPTGIGTQPGHDPFQDVLAAIRDGNTYVNIHTNDGVAPTNTGPGDFPGGEIRGQLDPH